MAPLLGAVQSCGLTSFSLILFRHTIQDDEEFGNGKARIGGPLASSDCESEDNLDEDEPMTMGNMKNMTTRNNNNNNNLKIYYNNHQNSSKKPFKMEVVDF